MRTLSKRFPHKIDHPINIIILQESMKNTIKTNFDILHFDRSRSYINPKNIFADLIALSEPFKPLCDQECTGLCSQCGVEKKLQIVVVLKRKTILSGIN